VAGTVPWLRQEQPASITSAVIPVDSGMTAGIKPLQMMMRD
jgi:hypothetical protein